MSSGPKGPGRTGAVYCNLKYYEQWNPHVHGVVSEGLFDRQGKFHHIPDLDAKLVEDHFCEKLLIELLTIKRIPIGSVSASDFQHNSAPFQCPVCARREDAAGHAIDQGN